MTYEINFSCFCVFWNREHPSQKPHQSTPSTLRTTSKMSTTCAVLKLCKRKRALFHWISSLENMSAWTSVENHPYTVLYMAANGCNPCRNACKHHAEMLAACGSDSCQNACRTARNNISRFACRVLLSYLDGPQSGHTRPGRKICVQAPRQVLSKVAQSTEIPSKQPRLHSKKKTLICYFALNVKKRALACFLRNGD